MFCTECGSYIEENARFCTGCGKPVGASAPVVPESPAAPEVPVAPAAPVETYAAPAAPEVNASAGMNFDFDTNTAVPGTKQRYTYKVLSQKDKWFSGKFDPMILEQAINAYAQQGWRLVGCATADIPGLGVTRQEFVAIMEREA